MSNSRDELIHSKLFGVCIHFLSLVFIRWIHSHRNSEHIHKILTFVFFFFSNCSDKYFIYMLRVSLFRLLRLVHTNFLLLQQLNELSWALWIRNTNAFGIMIQDTVVTLYLRQNHTWGFQGENEPKIQNKNPTECFPPIESHFSVKNYTIEPKNPFGKCGN